MLLSLNDDCLRLIIELLALEDQLSLLYVCQQLKMIVSNIWKQNCQKVQITRHQLEYFDEHEAHFLAYMRCISADVETLKLNRIKPTYIENMRNIEFPKAHTLSVGARFYQNAHDDIIRILQEIFPNVRSLELYGTFTGAHLCRFVQLEELKLDCCFNVKTKYFQKIFSRLRLKKLFIVFYNYDTCFDGRVNDIVACETLEELSLDDHHLKMVSKNLLKFKSLRKINCFGQTYISNALNKMMEYIGPLIETMSFNRCFWPATEHFESFRKLVSLRRLIFYNDDVSNEQLSTIGASFSQTLEEFYYLNGFWKDSTKYDGLLDIVRLSRKLKVIDISSTDIDVSFVEKVADIIAAEEDKRVQPLLLRCHGTKVTTKYLMTLAIPDELQISLESHEIELPEDSFFQAEWRKSSKKKNKRIQT